MQAREPFPPTRFIRQSELIPDILPFSSATLWRLVRSGEFPQPVKLSRGITAWRAEEIQAWIEAKGRRGS